MALDFQKILGRTFSENEVLKECFFVASNVVSIFYIKPYICTGDWCLWKKLFKFETLEKSVKGLTAS